MWNLAAPPEFRGLDPNKPLTVYQRHLPHWRQDGATYFVTFRLDDSLPQSKLNELKSIRKEWDRDNPPPQSQQALEQLAKRTMTKVEFWLDQGMGDCHLSNPEAARQVVESMHHFDGERYNLFCYVVMPNHVHAIVQPLLCKAHPSEKILQSWKHHQTREINQIVARVGGLWQDESFDRIIRDEEHLYRTIQYIGQNPQKAGLNRQDCPLWIKPTWHSLGWQFEVNL